MKKLFLSLMLLCSACATRETSPAGVNLMTESECEKIVDKYSDRIETYNGLYNTLHSGATLQNSQVALALTDQNARLFQWDQSKYNSERASSQERLTKETEVFLSFYTPDKKQDDLHKNNTIWKIFLDANGHRYEGKATKIKMQTVELQSLYPYHNRFSTPYKVVFPVSVKLIENFPTKLTLTGPVVSATLNFAGMESK